MFILLSLSGPLCLKESSLEYGYSVQPTSTWMLHNNKKIPPSQIFEVSYIIL